MLWEGCFFCGDWWGWLGISGLILVLYSRVSPDATSGCSIFMVVRALAGSGVGCEFLLGLVLTSWVGLLSSNWFLAGVGFLCGMFWFCWGPIAAGLVGLVSSMLLIDGWAPSFSTLDLGFVPVNLGFLLGVFWGLRV